MKIVRPTHSFWSRNMAKLPDTTCYHPNLLSTDIYLTEKAYEALSLWVVPNHENLGLTQVQKGVPPSLRISRKKGSFFKTSACPRFCIRRVLFCTQVRSMGVKIPLQSTKYTRFWRRVTPEVTGLPSLLPPLAAAKHAEDYKILS